MEDQLIIQLKQNIFKRATIFIENMGHFVPFGAKLQDDEIKDIVIYNDALEIDSQILIDALKNSISKDILNNGNVFGGAVAYDVIINLNDADGVLQKRDALCLITSLDGMHWNDAEFFPYLLIHNQCIWK